jgi:hypothetical protein
MLLVVPVDGVVGKLDVRLGRIRRVDADGARARRRALGRRLGTARVKRDGREGHVD